MERDREIENLKVKYGDFGTGYLTDDKTMGFLKRFLWRMMVTIRVVLGNPGSLRGELKLNMVLCKKPGLTLSSSQLLCFVVSKKIQFINRFSIL